MDETERQQFMALQNANQQKSADNAKMQQALALMQDNDEDNLVKWQLDISGTLTRIERLLRGDEPKTTEDGSIIWVAPEDESKQLMNNEGIRELMRIMTMYISKDLMLSRYNEKEIKNRMKNFSFRLFNLIYNKYDSFGWSKLVWETDPYTGEKFEVRVGDKEKIKHYEMLCTSIIDIVEASYNRALEGGERDSIGTRTSIVQTEPLNHGMQIPQVQKRSGFFNPSSWT